MSHEQQCKNSMINLSILQEMLKVLYTHTALFKWEIHPKKLFLRNYQHVSSYISL